MRVIPKNFETPDDIRRALQKLGEGRQPTSSVADLPTNAAVGTIRFATDALKVGQTTGNGTGTLVYYDGTAWRRVGDDTTAAV